MAIDHTDEKRFTQDQVHELFALVGWESAQYPDRVYRTLIGSSTVTAHGTAISSRASRA